MDCTRQHPLRTLLQDAGGHLRRGQGVGVAHRDDRRRALLRGDRVAALLRRADHHDGRVAQVHVLVVVRAAVVEDALRRGRGLRLRLGGVSVARSTGFGGGVGCFSPCTSAPVSSSTSLPCGSRTSTSGGLSVPFTRTMPYGAPSLKIDAARLRGADAERRVARPEQRLVVARQLPIADTEALLEVVEIAAREVDVQAPVSNLMSAPIPMARMVAHAPRPVEETTAAKLASGQMSVAGTQMRSWVMPPSPPSAQSLVPRKYPKTWAPILMCPSRNSCQDAALHVERERGVAVLQVGLRHLEARRPEPDGAGHAHDDAPDDAPQGSVTRRVVVVEHEALGCLVGRSPARAWGRTGGPRCSAPTRRCLR